ncbi:MAG: high frequency lysogenization protein HflD [Xanthomonadaceae bacterium]|nr:high frequency lysogenization protein HflD [Xanthomonadaceae bacterium]
MREGRVIALSGLFQALALVRAIAQRGGCDAQAMQQSLASVFRIDAESPAGVYGGVGNLRLGLETLVSQLGEGGKRDLALTRMAVQVMRLERSLMRNTNALNDLRGGIAEMSAVASALESGGVDPSGRLAELYAQTLSRLQPRIMVEGNPVFLQQAAQIDRIRALLMAAVRAAVLWRQLGGNQWSLLLRRRQYAMLARGLLAACAIGGK